MTASGAHARSRRVEPAEPVRVIARALEHWTLGEYHLCLSSLEELTISAQSSEAVLLAGRALLRVGRHAEAERRLTEGQLLHRSGDAVATHLLLMGVARARQDDFDGADRWFRSARAEHPHRSIIAEVAYEEALSRYQAGDLAGARVKLDGALRPIEDIIFARARSLAGWIETAHGNFRRAHEEFAASLLALEKCRARDAYLQSSIVYALAILCAELGISNPATLDDECAKIRWTSSMTCAHAQTLRHIGLSYQRRGNFQAAVARYIASAEAAEGTPWSIFGYAECANATLQCGETIAAGAFATKAVNIAERIDVNGGWERIEDEERLTLLVLAQVLARLGRSTAAHRYLALYERRRGIVNTRVAIGHDRRLEIFEAHVAAIVRADGRRAADTVAALSEVAARWEAIGYRARCSEALADAGRFGAHSGGTLPVSPPVKSAGCVASAALSVREEQIVRMVAAGHGDDAIARHFNLSPRTARNIVNGLYAKFGVHSRAQLVVAVFSAG